VPQTTLPSSARRGFRDVPKIRFLGSNGADRRMRIRRRRLPRRSNEAQSLCLLWPGGRLRRARGTMRDAMSGADGLQRPAEGVRGGRLPSRRLHLIARPVRLPPPRGFDQQVAEIASRATQESNLRPTAPEAGADANEDARLEGLWDQLGTAAEKYLRALEIRSRFVHTHGRELADSVLMELRRRRSRR
jgi:hypothetical protein